MPDLVREIPQTPWAGLGDNRQLIAVCRGTRPGTVRMQEPGGSCPVIPALVVVFDTGKGDAEHALKLPGVAHVDDRIAAGGDGLAFGVACLRVCFEQGGGVVRAAPRGHEARRYHSVLPNAPPSSVLSAVTKSPVPARTVTRRPPGLRAASHDGGTGATDIMLTMRSYVPGSFPVASHTASSG
jgi:hypothetical protein